MFQRPVEIGSLLFLSSMVVYVGGNKIQTRVHAEVVDMHTAKRETTNIFYFIFTTKDNNAQPLPNVVPKTYAGKFF
jgi:acyl-coenzyme A thioesterase 9